MIYRFVWVLCSAFFRGLLRGKITGLENVPATGPVILASNHISNLDPPLVSGATRRIAFYLAKEELFRPAPVAWFIKTLGAFPVKRGAPDRAALKRCGELLEQGHVVVIFPEGTRSVSGELKEPEMGIGMIAYRSGVPVVPIYVSGTNTALPKPGRLRFGRVRMSIGRPLVFQAPAGTRPGREEYDRAAHEIMAAIAALRDAQAVAA